MHNLSVTRKVLLKISTLTRLVKQEAIILACVQQPILALQIPS